MSFKGYGASGYEDLKSEIESRKTKIVDLLQEADTKITNAIKECWKGPDATAYMGELQNALKIAKEEVESAYQNFSSSCTRTYEEWVAKQNGN